MTLGLYLGFFAERFAREPRRRSEGVGFLPDIVGGGRSWIRWGTFQGWVVAALTLTGRNLANNNNNTNCESLQCCKSTNPVCCVRYLQGLGSWGCSIITTCSHPGCSFAEHFLLPNIRHRSSCSPCRLTPSHGPCATSRSIVMS